MAGLFLRLRHRRTRAAQLRQLPVYSGYNVRNGFPLDAINKWNTEKRYAKAYTYVQRDKTNNARIEIDVRIADTGADPARTFRAYFTKMKSAAEGFRKAIGFSQ